MMGLEKGRGSIFRTPLPLATGLQPLRSHYAFFPSGLLSAEQNRKSSCMRAYQAIAAAVLGSLPQRKSVPSVHMRWRATAI